MFNVFGQTIDGKEPIAGGEWRSIHTTAVPLTLRTTTAVIFTTGIKAIDDLAPLERLQTLTDEHWRALAVSIEDGRCAVTIRSAFDLPEKMRQACVQVLRERLSTGVDEVGQATAQR
jgi:hypothetical protein